MSHVLNTGITEIAEVCDRVEFNIWYSSAVMLIYWVVSTHAAPVTIIFCLFSAKQFRISINNRFSYYANVCSLLCIEVGNRIVRSRYVSKYNIWIFDSVSKLQSSSANGENRTVYESLFCIYRDHKETATAPYLLAVSSNPRFLTGTLTLWHLTTPIVVVPHR